MGCEQVYPAINHNGMGIGKTDSRKQWISVHKVNSFIFYHPVARLP